MKCLLLDYQFARDGGCADFIQIETHFDKQIDPSVNSSNIEK